MATLWIAEYSALARSENGSAQVADEKFLLAEQRITFAGSTQSAALNAKTRFVRLYSDTNCHILHGSDPTATTAKKPLAAQQVEYFGVKGGYKIAAITAAV